MICCDGCTVIRSETGTRAARLSSFMLPLMPVRLLVAYRLPVFARYPRRRAARFPVPVDLFLLFPLPVPLPSKICR